MRLERRIFLAQSARLLSLASLAATVPATLRAGPRSYPFSLGVASGSRFQALDDVGREDSGLSTLASFAVENGRAGAVPVT